MTISKNVICIAKASLESTNRFASRQGFKLAQVSPHGRAELPQEAEAVDRWAESTAAATGTAIYIAVNEQISARQIIAFRHS